MTAENSQSDPLSRANHLLSSPGYDLLAAVERMGGDELLLKDLIDIFFDEHPRMLDELAAAMDSRDLARLHRASLTLREAGGHFHALEVMSLAHKLAVACQDGRTADALVWSDSLDRQVRLLAEGLRAERQKGSRTAAPGSRNPGTPQTGRQQ